jgi:hypothetical protein
MFERQYPECGGELRLAVHPNGSEIANAGATSATSLSSRRQAYPVILLHAMNLRAFRASLTLPEPPAELRPAQAGLWWDARGDWARAHESAQTDDGPEGAWVHAYLHRKEGDASNAAYWYERAGKAPAGGSLEREWEEIARTLLE